MRDPVFASIFAPLRLASGLLAQLSARHHLPPLCSNTASGMMAEEKQYPLVVMTGTPGLTAREPGPVRRGHVRSARQLPVILTRSVQAGVTFSPPLTTNPLRRREVWEELLVTNLTFIEFGQFKAAGCGRPREIFP